MDEVERNRRSAPGYAVTYSRRLKRWTVAWPNGNVWDQTYPDKKTANNASWISGWLAV